jgi:hypothetical protein
MERKVLPTVQSGFLPINYTGSGIHLNSSQCIIHEGVDERVSGETLGHFVSSRLFSQLTANNTKTPSC